RLSGDTLHTRLNDPFVEDHAVEHVRQGRVSWHVSATTIGAAIPSWSLASAPLPLSYQALCYMVHLLPVGFPRDWSRVLSKSPFQALSCAILMIVCWPFPLQAGVA